MNLSVEPGELYGLIGDNGAGKTTTIGVITGQIRRDSGTAEVLGFDPGEDPVEIRSQVGILPEREEPPSMLTPREYFQFVGEIRDIPEREVDARIAEWASRLDFGGVLDTQCMDLSRGQKQMVMLTQAFLDTPELIIIDEPLTNLDPTRQERVKDALLDYQKAGNTIVLSTHRMNFAEDLCTRVAIVRNGKVVAVVKPGELPEDKSLGDMFSTYTAPLPDLPTEDSRGDE
jgi:ABC-2 type transport system ATP-binding protein